MPCVCASNNRTFTLIKQKLIRLKGKLNRSTLLGEDFNIHLSLISTTSHKTSKFIVA